MRLPQLPLLLLLFQVYALIFSSKGAALNRAEKKEAMVRRAWMAPLSL